MKQLLLTLILFVLTFPVFADDDAKQSMYNVDNLPVSTEFYDSIDFNAVCNPDHILLASEVDSLNSMLWSMRNKQGVQGLVIAINQSDPDDPYEFSIQVARKYGVGGKGSLGFVMLLTKAQRGYEILTGDGMEKFLTDAQCSSIGRRVMVPLFKEGKWGQGMVAGVRMIQGIVSGEVELNETLGDEEDDEGGLFGALMMIFGPIAGLGGLAYYSNRKAHTCPKCKKHNYGRTKRIVKLVNEMDNDELAHSIVALNGNTFDIDSYQNNIFSGISDSKNYRLREGIAAPVEVIEHYECSDCGHIHEKKFLSNSDSYYIGTFDGTGKLRWGEIIAAAAAGAAAGSSFSRRGGGGGSFHGPSSTFGGGSFSGGGAGGRF